MIPCSSVEPERIMYRCPIDESSFDELERVIELSQDVVVMDPKHEPSVFVEPPVPSAVAIRVIVAQTIHLDDESGLPT